MASGYKVRIADGSEIGPMDLAAVKAWYAQGLIGRDSPVLKPGSKRWSTLAEVAELKALAGPASRPSAKASAKGTAARAERAERDEVIEIDAATWRLRVAGGLFLFAALAVGLLALHPENAVSDLDGAPWLEIALGLVVLGLALLPGRDIGRKVVRVAAALIAVGMFPVMGILFAQGVRGPALLAVGSAWVVATGFFGYLTPSPSWPRLVLSLVPILAGAYGAFRFGYAPESSAQRSVREWTSPDRRFADQNLGLAFEAPRGWVILKRESTLLQAPADARLLLAHPRTGGFGYLVAETSPRGVSTLDQYLDRLITDRRKTVPSLKELGRTDTLVGRLSGRKSTGSSDDVGLKQRDLTLAWKDGWVYFGLVSWTPEEGAQRIQALDALAPAFTSQGILADRLQQAMQKVGPEVPQLTVPAVEALMSQSEAKVLEPDQVFRRSLDALVRSLPTLTPAETQELTQLISALYGVLPGKERGRLAAYVERVRTRQATTPQEDREMSSLMKTAVLRLGAGQRQRLQAFYEKAIRAS